VAAELQWSAGVLFGNGGGVVIVMREKLDELECERSREKSGNAKKKKNLNFSFNLIVYIHSFARCVMSFYTNIFGF